MFRFKPLVLALASCASSGMISVLRLFIYKKRIIVLPITKLCVWHGAGHILSMPKALKCYLRKGAVYLNWKGQNDVD